MTSLNSNKTVLIIGGGIAGLTAALALNRLGISVELLEKTAALGGKARHFCCKATDACQQCGACMVNDALRALSFTALAGDPPLTVRLETELTAVHREAKEFLYSYRSPEGAGEGRAAALLIAAGFDPFRAEDKPQYGYGRFPNVLTGLDLEKQLQQTGRIVRPSDGLPPQSLAFIQCVGSRDLHLGHPYCSQVCCGYALRLANLIRHRQPETAVTIFYMDIQTFGKEFPRFLTETRRRLHFIRAIPGDIQSAESDRLLLTFQPEDGSPTRQQTFDLVVLSIGLTPGKDLSPLVGLLDLPLNADGFLAKKGPAFSLTAAEGVFLAGAVAGPRSIARSVGQAHQAAEEIAGYLWEGGAG
ncbi:MAG: CoB--CoM heterodisulfide reductase iron-sulfur subunit A family protein [Deltaproteobacteria bacterium]|nr:CoB--CoM heterodisulfide reductase iron-sulfur subunit A family protein [Deltaproteobacteria bacterium]